MGLAVYVPSRVGEGYFTDWTAPASGSTDTGKVWVWNHTTSKYEPTALGTMAVATETNYLLASGSRAGAVSALQPFTSGIVTGIVRPESDSTAAFRVQNAAGSSDVLTVNTSGESLLYKSLAGAGQLLISGGPGDGRYVGMWSGVAASAASFANYAFLSIDNGTTDRQVLFNAPGTDGKLFFRQNNGTMMSLQSGRLQVSTNTSFTGDAGARLSVRTDAAELKAISVIAEASQTANLQEWQDDTGAVLLAVGPTGQIKTTQATTNTNTPSGATAYKIAIHNAAGTLLGYVPIYASAW